MPKRKTATQPAQPLPLLEPAVTEAVTVEPTTDAPTPTTEPTAIHDELLALYLGASSLAANKTGALAAVGERVLKSIVARYPANEIRRAHETVAERLPYEHQLPATRAAHRLIATAIGERRVLKLQYRSETDPEWRLREVEPFVQFFIHERWSFLAFDRAIGDLRQFRVDRCKDVVLTDVRFSPRPAEPNQPARMRRP